jgi:hypothetical protein
MLGGAYNTIFAQREGSRSSGRVRPLHYLRVGQRI